MLTRNEVEAQEAYPCIRCGHCLDACPVFLNPSQLGLLAQAARYEEMQERANSAGLHAVRVVLIRVPIQHTPLPDVRLEPSTSLGRARRKEQVA